MAYTSISSKSRAGRDNSYVTTPVVQCHGKKRYHSKAFAKSTIRTMRGVQGRDRITSYRCPHCGFFHIGHNAR